MNSEEVDKVLSRCRGLWPSVFASSEVQRAWIEWLKGVTLSCDKVIDALVTYESPFITLPEFRVFLRDLTVVKSTVESRRAKAVEDFIARCREHWRGVRSALSTWMPADAIDDLTNDELKTLQARIRAELGRRLREMLEAQKKGVKP